MSCRVIIPLLIIAILLITAIAGAYSDMPESVTPLLSRLSVTGGSSLEPPAPAVADYARAEKFLPQNAIPSVYNVNCDPGWIPGTSLFWYVDNGKDGTQFVLVNVTAETQAPAFDHEALADALAAASGTPVDPEHLPFSTITFGTGMDTVTFTAMNSTWIYELNTSRITKGPMDPALDPALLVSPDRKQGVFLKDNNLYIRDLASGIEYPLTTDGTADNFYARQSDTTLEIVSQGRSGAPVVPYAAWSPDSTRILTFQVDQQNVLPLHLLQDAPQSPRLRPVDYTYRYSMPGDENVAQYASVVIDTRTHNVTRAGYRPWPETSMMDTGLFNLQWWSRDSSRVWALYVERGETTLRFLEIDPVSGNARVVISESGPSYRESNLDYGAIPNIYVYEKNGDIIWFSERDGYGHLYLYDTGGQLKKQITSGEWVIRTLVHVDEVQDWIYFAASGKEPGIDPYYRQLYRVRPDGTGLTRLTFEDADHEISFAPDGSCFVDSYSRVDMAPVTVVKNADGTRLMDLETGDISYLAALGWKPPERITVKARDGTTDLYGLVFYPTDFDPQMTYPVVDSVYPGPQYIVTSKKFPAEFDWTSKIFWKCQALSELGFIVVNIDGLGTPYRSKAFHDVSYGHMGDAGGLTDHVGGITLLAASRKFMDLEHVGMYGHSGGGFMTAQALLTYPEFYKAGVASAGNQDNRLYESLWGEKYEGMPDGNNYLEQVTAKKAGNLTGNLLLVTGDLDDNVHPSMTMQLASALVNANKTFDMLVLPNRNHEFNYDPYFIKRQFDYLVLHLKGSTPPEYVFNVPAITD